MNTTNDLAAETRAMLDTLHWARLISAADRLTAFLQTQELCGQRTSDADTALTEALQLTAGALALLSGPKALREEIKVAKKLAGRSAGACCDLAHIGGHSHRAHRPVRLRWAWSGYPTGSLLSMPESLAHGLKAGGFGEIVD